MKVDSLSVGGQNPDFESAFQAAAKERVSVVISILSSLLNRNTKRIVDLATKHRLPSMYERSDYVDAGGLMSYSTNDSENYRRVAYYVDKILKGAKPGNLPIEQPTRFELVINLRAAKQINLTVPPNVLARADRVIR